MATLANDRAAMRDEGLQPIPFDDKRACFGRLDDGQCTDCKLRVLPSDYAGQFPAIDVIVPNLQERGLGQWRRLHCLDRRTNDTHSPDASVSGESGSVGAVAIHGATVQHRTEQGKPLGQQPANPSIADTLEVSQ